MASTASDKGKGRANPPSSSSPDSDSSSEADSSDSELEEEQTLQFLDSLLAAAREHARSARDAPQEEAEIPLDGASDPAEHPLPSLDPGALPAPYIALGPSRHAGPSALHDPDVARAESASARAGPAPAPPSSATPLAKQAKKATAGPGWFDLPAPAAADRPRLFREVEALRLRNQLDPKRFYRKDAREARGLAGLPPHFAIGTIVPTASPFGAASADNLSRASRKRTLVDELVDDAEAKSYAKKKFKELQTVRGAKGRGTLAKKQALRKPKW